eukprot:COSAG06_NODE_19631_length_830_cov_0.755130_1_plen_47_part_10
MSRAATRAVNPYRGIPTGSGGAACFFKQKTAYEMESRDWSSDVCSSD